MVTRGTSIHLLPGCGAALAAVYLLFDSGCAGAWTENNSQALENLVLVVLRLKWVKVQVPHFKKLNESLKAPAHMTHVADLRI